MIKRSCSWLLMLTLILGLLFTYPVRARAESAMVSSDALVDFIKTIEGFVERPVWDYGQWTVGYGTQCPGDLVETYQANGISVEAAEQLLRTHLNNFEAAVNSFIDTYGLSLQQHQFDALISFSYNCGTGWLREETGFFNQAVRSGDMSNAFLYAICLWSSAGGDYILMNRRMCEANMYINGVYSWSVHGDNYPENFRWVYLDGNGGTVSYRVYGFDSNNPAALDVGFTELPMGTAPDGSAYPYILDGWYTADGVKVEVLDGTVTRDQVLTARWLDSSGNVVEIPKGDAIEPLQVAVNANGVNIRSGPGTQYTKVDTANAGDLLTVTRVCKGGSYTWGLTEKGWISLSFTTFDTARDWNGWMQENGSWVYYEAGFKVKDRWVQDTVGWCYLGSNGTMVTNSWIMDSVGWCFVGEDGYCVTNRWVADSIGWCYLDDAGRMVSNCWVQDSVGWCYVGEDGYCVTDRWAKDTAGWCYLDSEGRMATNRWIMDSVGWCYVGEDGYCVTNKWVMDTKGWCYLDAEGRMVTDTYVDGYYINAKGYRVS